MYKRMSMVYVGYFHGFLSTVLIIPRYTFYIKRYEYGICRVFPWLSLNGSTYPYMYPTYTVDIHGHTIFTLYIFVYILVSNYRRIILY